jgi:hypothetical protein
VEKIDFKRKLKHLYRPKPNVVVEVDVPTLVFLVVDGAGDPAGQEYADAVEALFALSYALKFMVKTGAQIDYGVMPLEGLWWADDMSRFSVDDKSSWKWTMMIMQPELVTRASVDEAIGEVARRKRLAALDKVRFEAMSEGRCAQTLHIGPFSEEGPTVEKLHRYIEERSALRGRHHEIYLSDIRRGDPAKWKTVIRQPME